MTQEQFDLLIQYLDAINGLMNRTHNYLLFTALVITLAAGLYIGHRWAGK